MRKIVLLSLLTCISSLVFGQTMQETFDSFRKGMLSDYHGFRKSVLDDYAKYLDGVWERHEAFRGTVRDKKPKPTYRPKADGSPTAPVDVPTPDKPKAPIVPTKPQQVPAPSPTPTPVPTVPVMAKQSVNFYGMPMLLPKVNVVSVRGVEGRGIADAWREYEHDNAKDVIPTLKNIISTKGLNDWFAFQLVRKYADAVAKDGSNADRVVLQHFLLANMGYDVRLGRTENQMLLLVPFKQQVYARSFMRLKDDQKYYIFYDEYDGEKPSEYLYTCDLPADADCGKVLNLAYDRQCTIGYGKTITRELTDDKLTVRGTVNQTMMEMLRHYPQMDIPVYAQSTVDETLHKEILKQLRPQIEGLSKRDAANRLLQFVQFAFTYATDGDQHGYEKAYFLEENFYYTKNDCEDRSIFYAFLVRNLLGLDVHLIHYPGHECTAVSFPGKNPQGHGYMYEGKRFVICDPTYIGASIGQCMPDYRTTKPEIELW